MAYHNTIACLQNWPRFGCLSSPPWRHIMICWSYVKPTCAPNMVNWSKRRESSLYPLQFRSWFPYSYIENWQLLFDIPDLTKFEAMYKVNFAFKGICSKMQFESLYGSWKSVPGCGSNRISILWGPEFPRETICNCTKHYVFYSVPHFACDRQQPTHCGQ